MKKYMEEREPYMQEREPYMQRELSCIYLSEEMYYKGHVICGVCKYSETGREELICYGFMGDEVSTSMKKYISLNYLNLKSYKIKYDPLDGTTLFVFNKITNKWIELARFNLQIRMLEEFMSGKLTKPAIK